MRLPQVFASRTLPLIVLFVLLGLAHSFSAQPIPGRAEVRAIKGTASYSTNGSPARPLKVGTVLRSGYTVKTGTNSTVDLFLGTSTGVIRIAESTTLTLDLLALTDTGADLKVEVQLDLPDGEMYFNVNKLSKPSRYEIKMPSGVAGIRGTKGSFSSRPGNARPPIVLLEGTLEFVHVGTGGTLTTHRLKAPPAVYFSPVDGIKAAPAEMVQQTLAQLDSAAEAAKPTTRQSPTKQSSQQTEPVTTRH